MAGLIGLLTEDCIALDVALPVGRAYPKIAPPAGAPVPPPPPAK